MDVSDRNKVRDSLMRDANRTLTICEQMRRLYDRIYELPDGPLKAEMTEILVDAFIMAKKMSARLEYYFTTYRDATGSEGDHLREVLHDRKLLQKRRERTI